MRSARLRDLALWSVGSLMLALAGISALLPGATVSAAVTLTETDNGNGTFLVIADVGIDDTVANDISLEFTGSGTLAIHDAAGNVTTDTGRTPSEISELVIRTQGGDDRLRPTLVDLKGDPSVPASIFPADFVLRLLTSAGDDRVEVAAANLRSGHTIAVFGGGAELDEVIVTGTSLEDSFSIRPGGVVNGLDMEVDVELTGFGTVAVRAAEELRVTSLASADTLVYTGARPVATSPHITLEGRNANDRIIVLAEPPSRGLTVDGGPAIDELTVQTSNGPDAVTVDGNTVSADVGADGTAGIVTFAEVERLLVDTLRGIDVITALSTPPELTETELRGKTQDDTISITMRNLASPVYVPGNRPSLVEILDQEAGRPTGEGTGDGNVLILDATGLSGLTFDTDLSAIGQVLREVITASTGQQVRHSQIGRLVMTVDSVTSSIAGFRSLHPFTDHEISDGSAVLKPPTIIATSAESQTRSAAPISILGTNLENASVTIGGLPAAASFDSSRTFDHASFPLTSGIDDDGQLGNGLGVLTVTIPSALPAGAARIAVTNSSGTSVPHDATVRTALDSTEFGTGLPLSDEFLANAFNDIFSLLATGTPPAISDVAGVQLNLTDPPHTATFTVSDAETPAGQLGVTGTSDNQSVLPNASILIQALGGGSWQVTVAPQASGVAHVTLLVTDSDFNVGTERFSVLVGVPNQAPTITGNFADLVRDVGAELPTNRFSIADAETPVGDLQLAVTADNSALIPPGGISVTATGVPGEFDLSLTPAPGITGATLIKVAVTDEFGATAVREFDVLIRAIGEQRPLTGADTFNTPAGVLLDVAPAGVLANDFEPDGQAMTAVLVPGSFDAAQGTLSLLADGGFTFTSTPSFNGVATFRYRAVDSAGTPSLATTVSILVAGSTTPGPSVDEGALASTLSEFVAVDVDGDGSVGGNDESLDGRTLTSIAQAILGATTYTGAGTLSVLVSVDGGPPVEPANATLAVGGPFTLTWQVRANTVPAQFSQPLTQSATVLAGDGDQDGDGLTNAEEEALGSDVTDPCSPLDVTGDGAINLSDLLFIIARLGLNDEPALDFDQSGVVDLSDVLAVVGAFGTTCS